MNSKTLGTTFDPRANALNLIRLLLAGTVIVWHSFPLGGSDIAWAPARRILSEVGVDGFFAISGYLIVASWVRTPDWRRFLRARALRILPAFWICLMVTALVIAPLTAGALGLDNVLYVLKNAALWIFQYDIAGTPAGVPYEAAWNGSLWTLAWEFLCYLGVLVLGVTGMLRRQLTLPILFGLALLGAAVTTTGLVDNNYIHLASRFGLMFLAGAVVWQVRERLPVRRDLVVGAVLVLAAATLTPNYRILAALPLAYLVLLAGSCLRAPRFRLRNDISYGVYIYAFPVQQVLATVGAYRLGVGAYAFLAVLGTVPLAVLSWFLVEKPMMRLNRGTGRTRPDKSILMPEGVIPGPEPGTVDT